MPDLERPPEKTLDQHFQSWEGHAFGFGYGSGEPHIIPALKHLLALCPETGAYDYQVLESALGGPVAWLLLNRLHQLDVFEYGTSPRYAWLTQRGLYLKRFMDTKTADDLVELVACRSENDVICYPNACNCGPDGYDAKRICPNPFWGRANV